MPRQGKSLERLVASIERVLADETTVEIESPKRLPDRITGKLREFDVVLTMRQGHHTILVAIECRDRSRPIGVPQVEAFSAKCSDTGINQGIMVSTSGFYNTAREKANHYGIRCLEIDEVDSFESFLAPEFILATRKLHRHAWMFVPQEEGLVTRETMEVLTPDSSVLELIQLKHNAEQLLEKLLPPVPEPTEKREINVRIGGGGLILRNTETGATTPVKWAAVKLIYSVVHEIIPFRLKEYRDKDEDQHITDIAVAEIRLGDKSGDIMIVYRENKGTQIVFSPNPPTSTDEPN